MEKSIYTGNGYEFLLLAKKIPVSVPASEKSPAYTSEVTHAEIVRQPIQKPNSSECLTLMEYTWPVQLSVELSVGSGVEILSPGIGPDGILRFSIHVVSHHRTGMALGEFVEEELYEVLHPFDEGIVCRVTDIVRKTRFALAERHLEHLPNQTYPPVDGRQGPYGHPTGRKFRGIAVRKRKKPAAGEDKKTCKNPVK